MITSSELLKSTVAARGFARTALVLALMNVAFLRGAETPMERVHVTSPAGQIAAPIPVTIQTAQIPQTPIAQNPGDPTSRSSNSAPANGLTIVPTFDSTITNDAQAATIMATINQAIADYKNCFSNNITVNIKFQEMSSGLGQSNFYLNSPSYSSYRAALVSHSTSTDDTTALAHLPAGTNDPVTNSSSVVLSIANANALGLTSNSGPQSIVSLNTSICNLSPSQTDPSKYSLYAVVCHEIDEVLGSGSNVGSSPASPPDLFRYDQNGARSFSTSTSAQAYFSIDGTTDLARYNQDGAGDYGDWYSPGGQTPQVQDAYATPGAAPKLGVELRLLDVIGYTRNFPIITPSTLPQGTAGTAYNQTLTVTNCTPPYSTFSVTSFNAGTTGLSSPATDSTAGTFTLSGTPATGSLSFTVNVTDKYGASTSQNYTLSVMGPPTANTQSVNVPFNTATGVTLTATDSNTPPLTPLTFNVTVSPSHGTLSGTAPNLTYTPNAGYNGADSFKFTATNTASLTSAAATVTLTVAKGTPTANAQSLNVSFNTAKGITLTGTDPDSPALSLTFNTPTNPTHGTLSGFNSSTGAVTYTPTANYHGSDSFTFTVTNGTNTSTSATVTLTVAPGTPAANAQSVNVSFNTAKGITLTGSDPDSPALTLTFNTPASPAHGTLSGFNSSTGAVTYTPNANYQGSDSFTFTVTNGTNTSPAGTVTLSVAPGTPTANAQSVNVSFNTAKGITLTGTDPDSPALALTFNTPASPAHGTLSAFNASTGAVTYTPAANYQGADSFTFTVTNGTKTSSAATVTIAVAAGTPTANAQSVNISHGTAKGITLTGSDPDSPALPLTFNSPSIPAHGTLSGFNSTTGAVTYTPSSNYQGTDSFTFTVTNGTNTSAASTVSLTVAPGIPTANAQSVNAIFNTAKVITMTGSDPDSPALPLTFNAPSAPAHGTLSGFNATTGAVTYTPNANYQGPDSFTFTVSNGTNTSTSATVSITVPSGTPTAIGQNVNVTFNTAKTIMLTGTDPNLPPMTLTFNTPTNPAHGTLSGFNAATGAVTYTPSSNYQGSDSFTFTVSNSLVTSTAGTVTLTVAPGTPTADSQAVNVALNTATGITLTGTDPDNPVLPLTFNTASNPAHGTLNGLNTSTGALTYTPNSNYHGTDSFTFTVSNGTHTSASSTVSVTVNPGTPTANPQSVAVAINVAKTITLTGSDPNVPALPISFGAPSSPSHGTLSNFNAATGAVTYTPAANFQGTDSFTFTVSNGPSTSAPATVKISTAILIAPATLPDALFGAQYNQALTASGGTAPFTFSLTSGTLPDGLTLSPVGVLSGTPAFGGTFNFSITAADSSISPGPFSSSQAYTVNISPGILTQPANVSVFAGQTAALNVIASGSNLTYQWYQGASGDISTPVSGATAASLTTGVLLQSTQFWVRVTNAGGSTDSASATVIVTSAPSPQLSSPPQIPSAVVAGQPFTITIGDITSGSGTTPTISVDYGDGTPADSTLTHTYTVPGVYTVTITLSDPFGTPAVFTESIFISSGLTGGATPPLPAGASGILVGASGLTLKQGGFGSLSVNHKIKAMSKFMGRAKRLAFSGITQASLTGQAGTLTLGSGALAQSYNFTVDKHGNGSGRILQINIKTASLKVSIVGPAALETLAESMVATMVNGKFYVPMTVAIGNKVHLAFSFELTRKGKAGGSSGIDSYMLTK